MNYLNDEEKYFSDYLFELQEAGFIYDIVYQPKAKILFEGLTVNRNKEKVLKKGTIIVQEDFILLQPHKYTPDFLFKWTPKGIPLVNTIGNFVKGKPFIANTGITGVNSDMLLSVIDTKGTFANSKNSSALTFPLNQKWIFQQYGIYVQKIVVGNSKGIFKDTFCPKTYITTPKKGIARTIHFPVRTIEQYIDEVCGNKN